MKSKKIKILKITYSHDGASIIFGNTNIALSIKLVIFLNHFKRRVISFNDKFDFILSKEVILYFSNTGIPYENTTFFILLNLILNNADIIVSNKKNAIFAVSFDCVFFNILNAS